MQIIDKLKDYYDYYQNIYIDKTLAFDRRGSYYLSDQLMLNYFKDRWDKKVFKQMYWLLQAGYDNWLIKAYDPVYTEGPWPLGITIEDCKTKLVRHWKNYDHCNLLKLTVPTRKGYDEVWDYSLYGPAHGSYNEEKVTDELVNDINRNNCDFLNFRDWYNRNAVDSGHYPILGGTRIPSLVDAFDLYQAIETYFSHQKDEKVTDNQTDVEKVISHGFDKRSSFRSVK